MDQATTDDQRQILRLVFSRQEFAWPFAAPPDSPPTVRRRCCARPSTPPCGIRTSDDARRMALEVNPVSGHAVETLIEELYGTPEAVIAKTRHVITAQ